MSDWIPSKDQEFDLLVTKLTTWISVPANSSAAGIDVDTFNAFISGKTDWTTAFAALLAHDAAGAPITVAKVDAHDALEVIIRAIGALLRAKNKLGSLTNAQLVAAGVPVSDGISTPSTTPTSKPVIIRIEPPQRLQHIIHWRDEFTPDSKAKPAGAKRAILFLKIGNPPPAGPSEMEEVAADTATPYLMSFDEADANKPAHWALCWEANPGQRGPMSVVSTWTIPG